MRLDASAVTAGFRLEALSEIDSTNLEAQRRAQAGENGPLWITAGAQSAGRGRMDRSWASPAGNLYASLLLSDPAPLPHAPELAFVAALAVRDAVIAAAPGLAPVAQFKWPNDLLLAGRKCAGILIEGEASAGRSASVVVGIGVNCMSHPPATPDRPATDLSCHGAAVTPEQLFERLSAAMCRRLVQWDRGAEFAGIRADWLAAARGVGEGITVRNGGGDRHGRFVGLDASGCLLLELPSGATEKIAAGDVFPFEVWGGRAAGGA